MADTVTRTVSGLDVVCWMEPSKHTKSGYAHRTADRGDTIELPAAEADRLDGLGAFNEPAADPAGVWAPADEDAIEAMNVAEVTAYLGQVPEALHDDELDRILSIENGRAKPRTGVLSLDPDFEADPDDAAGDPST